MLKETHNVGFFTDLHIGVHQNSEKWHDVSYTWAKWFTEELKKKNYSSKILLSSDYNDMGRQIKKINNKINLKYKDNRRVKKYFFNC